jgi:hypothetical protein
MASALRLTSDYKNGCDRNSVATGRMQSTGHWSSGMMYETKAEETGAEKMGAAETGAVETGAEERREQWRREHLQKGITSINLKASMKSGWEHSVDCKV